MMMKYLVVAALASISFLAQAQQNNNPYGLHLITSVKQLQQTIEADSNKAFVHIKDYVPDITLDVKYATTQNVFYEQLYKKPYAITRLSVAKALQAVQQELKQQGLGLKIYDAYRPYAVTSRMFDILPDTIYMGLPSTGSKHNRGIALDLTIIDFKTKEELDMPTPFDALVYASNPQFMGLPEHILQNRKLLMTVMQKHGFSVDPMEWWHYNYIPGAKYDLLDMKHEDIITTINKR